MKTKVKNKFFSILTILTMIFSNIPVSNVRAAGSGSIEIIPVISTNNNLCPIANITVKDQSGNVVGSKKISGGASGYYNKDLIENMLNLKNLDKGKYSVDVSATYYNSYSTDVTIDDTTTSQSILAVLTPKIGTIKVTVLGTEKASSTNGDWHLVTPTPYINLSDNLNQEVIIKMEKDSVIPRAERPLEGVKLSAYGANTKNSDPSAAVPGLGFGSSQIEPGAVTNSNGEYTYNVDMSFLNMFNSDAEQLIALNTNQLIRINAIPPDTGGITIDVKDHKYGTDIDDAIVKIDGVVIPHNITDLPGEYKFNSIAVPQTLSIDVEKDGYTNKFYQVFKEFSNTLEDSGDISINTPNSILLTGQDNYKKLSLELYKLIKGTLTVSYIDENNNLIEPSTVKTNLDLGDYTEYAKVFNGYTLTDLPSRSARLTEYYPTDTITFRYTKNSSIVVNKCKLTIKYVDENSNLLEPETVKDNLNLDSYTEFAKSFQGYILDDQYSKTVTFSSDNKDQTIIFHYKKDVPIAPQPPVIKGSTTIQYKDEDTRELLEPETINSNLDLGTYSYVAKMFDNYNLNDQVIKSTTLTADNKDQVVLFKYKKNLLPPQPPIIVPPTIKGSYIIQYKDQDAGTLLEPETTKTNLDLGTYTELAKSFDGYILNDDSSKIVILTDSIAKTIVFNYRKIVPNQGGSSSQPIIKGSYKIRYIDDRGNLLDKEVFKQNLDLGTYTEQARSFKDYSLIDSSSKLVTLTKENKDQVIEFKYTNGSYKVRYVDAAGGLLDNEVIKPNLELGKYTEQAKGFKGYRLNDKSIKSVILTVDNKEQILEFKYDKVKGSYKVRYIDDSGNLLDPEMVKQNLELGKYTEQAKSFKGYKLNDESSKSVVLTEENKDQAMEFKYKKEVPGIKDITELPQTGDTARPDFTLIWIILSLGSMFLILKKTEKYK